MKKNKCYLSKKNNIEFVVRGTGKPLRQFIYSKDLANLIVWTLFHYHENESIILSVDENDEVSIEYIARLIAKQYNYEHMLKFDTSYSDGQFKKTADNSKLKALYPDFKYTDLEIGIEKSVKWFIDNYQTCRK